MASDKELSDFLKSVERRAFKQAAYVARNDDAALDVVQEAMIKLAESYGNRPVAELAPLFQRILQNKLNDHFRREKLRNTWVSLFSSFTHAKNEEEEEFDLLESYSSHDSAQTVESGAEQLERAQILKIIENEVERLPARQREAFLMRYWHEMDVAETAKAMGCTEGSVKTHCSRATNTLAEALKAKGIRL